MPKAIKKFIKFLITIILVVGIYYVGYAVGHKNLIIEEGYQPRIIGIESGKPKDLDFSIFWNAWDTLKANFFGQLDNKNLIYGAISGMVEAANDPYTTYLTPEDAQRFDEDLSGSFDGIGAEIENKNGLLIVVAPLDDSPAKMAGLRSQDVILKIDGEDVSKMTFYGAINKIRGKKGTVVTVSIYRPSTKENLEIKITRDTIKVNSVKWEEKNGILVIKIAQFGEDTVSLTKQAAQLIIDKNYPGLIIDLRDNPGGYLESAVDIASLFVDNNKTIVQEENNKGEKKQIPATLNPILKNKKLVVLINEGSASASEIFAGAIGDYQLGTVIGQKSFGKGSVQSLEDLKDGSKIKITVAKWLTPKGRAIDKEGIKPDIEVKINEDDIKNKRDPQLDRALEEVNR